MVRVFLCGLLTLGGLVCPPRVAAHHFTIDLKVEADKTSKTVHAETAGLGVKPKERPVLRVKAGSRLTVKWTMTNADPKTTFKNVLVHFFAVKEDKVGQRSVPKLTKGLAAESALNMD